MIAKVCEGSKSQEPNTYPTHAHLTYARPSSGSCVVFLLCEKYPPYVRLSEQVWSLQVVWYA